MASNASASSKALPPKLFALLKEQSVSSKKFLEYEKDIENFDRVIHEKRDLEKKLNVATASAKTKEAEHESFRSRMKQEFSALRSGKDEEIAKLRASKDALMEEFQTKYKDWDSRSTKQQDLNAQVEDLKRKLKQADESGRNYKESLRALQVMSRESEDALKGMKYELEEGEKKLRAKELLLLGTSSALDRCGGELTELKNAIGLVDLDQKDQYASRRLENLSYLSNSSVGRRIFEFSLANAMEWQDISSELSSRKDVTRYFSLHDFRPVIILNSVQNTLSTKLQKSGFYKATLRSIPISNSVESQHLRMAAAQCIIARGLCHGIFKPYYQPESPAAREAIDEVLERLSSEDPFGEALFRRKVLHAYEGKDGKQCEGMLVNSISEKIRGLVDPLLFPTSLRETFQVELEKLLQQAIQLWSPLQRSTIRGRIEEDPEKDWDHYDWYDTEIDLPAEQEGFVPAQSHPILLLFPRVLVGDKIICPGYALWSDQNTVVAANLEYGHPNRRLSLPGPAIPGERAGGDSPKSSRKSFSGHVQSRNLVGQLPGDNGDGASKVNGR